MHLRGALNKEDEKYKINNREQQDHTDALQCDGMCRASLPGACGAAPYQQHDAQDMPGNHKKYR